MRRKNNKWDVGRGEYTPCPFVLERKEKL